MLLASAERATQSLAIRPSAPLPSSRIHYEFGLAVGSPLGLMLTQIKVEPSGPPPRFKYSLPVRHAVLPMKHAGQA